MYDEEKPKYPGEVHTHGNAVETFSQRSQFDFPQLARPSRFCRSKVMSADEKRGESAFAHVPRPERVSKSLETKRTELYTTRR